MCLMKRILFALGLLLAVACSSPKTFVTIDGPTLVGTDGQPFLIKGTNLGNWLNPEGYMFNFGRATSPRLINEAFSQLLGPDGAADFWKAFKDNYITEDDIAFIASTGANTIRLPFHYKLFTDEDYMGLTSAQDGFERVDKLVEWCRAHGLYLILDMHDAPGGQTGDNIDDSYGYPWLFESEASQALFCDIWKRIAAHYKNEPVILGYELCNEPIATHFREKQDELNQQLEPLYKRAVAAIREVDKNHIVLLGGAQWNGNFSMFTDWKFDDKIMYTCHRYGGGTDADAIRSFIEFRDKTNLPMYMGEIGHGTDLWQAEFCKTLEDNNIGWTFWPYKKIDGSCMMAYKAPEGWDVVRRFADGRRASFGELRRIVPDRDSARAALSGLLEAVKFANCEPQTSYIRSIHLKPAQILVLRELGGHHLPFTEATMPWLQEVAKEKGFEITERNNLKDVDAAFLAGFDAVLQLDFPPYPWPEKVQEAFIQYVNRGGGWVGLHHASLLGEFDGYPMWPWFSQFLGGIRFDNYIADLSDGRVDVEAPEHPIFAGVPASFTLPDDEWYTYDKNPRKSPDVKVLATVDESSYTLSTPVKMGDHPVIWTNTSVLGRNVYFQFGHSPKLMENEAFKTLLVNSILWAAVR